ncbi:MAG: hypothetical protein R2852_04635 [Bacteroidia bacterium]
MFPHRHSANINEPNSHYHLAVQSKMLIVDGGSDGEVNMGVVDKQLVLTFAWSNSTQVTSATKARAFMMC